MPLALEYFHTRMAGVSDRDAGYDAKLNFDCLRDATVRFGWDWAPGMAVPPSRSLEALGSKQIRWPGGDLPDDVQFQWVEDEYLKADEYDAFLADPTRFTLHALWPRLASAFGVLGELPLPPVWWINTMYFPLAWGALLGAPPMTAMFEALAEMSRDAGAFMAAFGGFMGQMAGMGYPVAFVGRDEGAIRHGLRRLPRPARQHARPLPAAGQAAGAHGDADADGDRPGDRRRKGQREPARVHPAAPRRRRLPQR